MFPQRLKNLRKQKDLTQTELANLLNLSHGAIAMWETGKRQPDNDTLLRIADFFNVTVDYLLGRDNEKTPPNEDLSEGEMLLLDLFRNASEEQQQMVLQLLRLALSQK